MTHDHERAGLPATAAEIAALLDGRHRDVVRVAAQFAWGHLPPDLAEVSRAYCRLMLTQVALAPDSPDLTYALRQLLAAKDAGVRAVLPPVV